MVLEWCAGTDLLVATSRVSRAIRKGDISKVMFELRDAFVDRSVALSVVGSWAVIARDFVDEIGGDVWRVKLRSGG